MLYSWQNVNRPKRWEVRWVMQRTLRASDAVLCANREAMEVLRQHGYRRQMRVVPAIGVDTRVFSPGPARPAGQGPFVIGYVGRLVAEKGLDTLLAALSHLKQTSGDNLANPVSLLIVGGGPYRAVLERQVRDECLGDSVTFTSARAPAQVAELMRQMDVLVLPSRRTSVWKEQFGRVLVEAMACKVPVVASDSGAIPEVVGEAGLLFPEGDAVALASCLRRLMESPALRQGLAAQGYTRTMSLYTQERIADQTAQFYRHMIAER